MIERYYSESEGTEKIVDAVHDHIATKAVSAVADVEAPRRIEGTPSADRWVVSMAPVDRVARSARRSRSRRGVNRETAHTEASNWRREGT